LEEELSQTSHDQGVFEFEGWRLDAAEHRLIDPGDRLVQLPARLFHLLHYMVGRQDRLLSRQALLDAVWRNVVVEENSLNQAISALRRRLGDANGERRFIETVPGVGYRFIAPVRVRTAAPTHVRRETAAAASATRQRHPTGWAVGALALTGAIAVGAFSLLRTPDAADSGRSYRTGWDTQNVAAEERFVLATGKLNEGGPDNFTRAAELLEEAITLDPDFGHAWAQLNKALTQMIIAGAPANPAELQRRSTDALHEALALAPDVTEVLELQYQSALSRHDWRLAGSTAARLDVKEPPARPECSHVAHFEFYALGRGMTRAAVCAQDWLRAKPLSLQASVTAQTAFHAAGRDDLAEAEYARSRDLAGDHGVIEFLALIRMWGRADPAAVKAQLQRLNKAMPLPLYDQLLDNFEDPDAELALLRETYDADPSGGVFLASWLDRYGDPARAADALYHHYMEQHRSMYAELWEFSPAARSQRRFRQLMMDLGLIDYFRDTDVWNDYCQPLGKDDFDCSLSGPAQEHTKLVSSTG
jgi:DNA-binding winged helix-turn-helix (wHTH) protein